MSKSKFKKSVVLRMLGVKMIIKVKVNLRASLGVKNKNLLYLFEYKSHFFVPKYCPKSQVQLIHEYVVHCIRYKIFLRYFSCYCFLRYRLSFDHVTYRLSTQVTLHCITCHPHSMLMRMFQR